MLTLLTLLAPAHADPPGLAEAPGICAPLQLDLIAGTTIMDGDTDIPIDTDPLLLVPTTECGLDVVALVDLTSFETIPGTAEFLQGQRAVHWPGLTLVADHEYALDDGVSQLRFQTGSAVSTPPSNAPSYTVVSRSITPFRSGVRQITLEIEASEPVLVAFDSSSVGYVLPSMGTTQLSFFPESVDLEAPLCVTAQARNDAGELGASSEPDCGEPVVNDTIDDEPGGCSSTGGTPFFALLPLGMLAIRRRQR